jgi:hypothetical protein
MQEILSDAAFRDFHRNGYLGLGSELPLGTLSALRDHYQKLGSRNDSICFLAGNEHLGYAESWSIGVFMNVFGPLGRRYLKRVFDASYEQCIFSQQAFIEPVLTHLLANGFARHFRTRFILASHDMFLSGDARHPGAPIHVDTPNFHHFYETENDLSLFVPLVDLDETNGGRLSVLPESKLKGPFNVLLKMVRAHFSSDPACLDENGDVDPDRIDARRLRVFVKSATYQTLLGFYGRMNALARTHYADELTTVTQRAGEAILFCNKNYHAAEKWRNAARRREVYVIRMSPLYDAGIRLRRQLHGAVVNNFLIDMQEKTITRFSQAVDVRTIASAQKLAL